MGLIRLHQLLDESCFLTLPGEPITCVGDGTWEHVDCLLVLVQVDLALAKKHEQEVLSLAKEALPERILANGANYLEVGELLGDEAMAFKLFAFGRAMNWWEIVLPEMLGVDDENLALELAGNGLVMITGLNKEEES